MKSLYYHAYTAYLFSCNNIKDIVCMGYLFGISNASIAGKLGMGPDLPLQQILASSPAMLLWSWSNLFLFNLHNQRHASAISEDRINKPWRPLPSGRITPSQVNWVMYSIYPLVLTVSGLVGGLGPCCLEAFLCLWYNEWGGASNPFVKNFLNGAGFACFFAGPLEVATGHSILYEATNMKVFWWLLVLAGAITTTSHAQDFRDVTGDQASGRNTVPLVLGDGKARIILVAGIMGWTAASCWLWEVGSTTQPWTSCIVAWIAAAVVSQRFLFDRSREGDIRSWKLYPFWLFGLILIPSRII